MPRSLTPAFVPAKPAAPVEVFYREGDTLHRLSGLLVERTPSQLVLVRKDHIRVVLDASAVDRVRFSA